MVLVEVLLSDAAMKGSGGMHHLALMLDRDDLDRLVDMVEQSRRLPQQQCMFRAGPNAVDVRFVIAVTPIEEFDDDGDDGEGEEIIPPEIEAEKIKEGHSRRKAQTIIPEA